jgi:hypothetical protein
MMKETIFNRPVLTKAWEEINLKEPCFFDTVNTYAKKDHIDGMKDGPIGWEDDAMTIEDCWDCIEDDICTVILSKGKDKALVVLERTLPAILIQGKKRIEIDWAEYAQEGCWSIREKLEGYRLEAIVINPKVKTLEGLGVLKKIIKQALAKKDLINGGTNEPADPTDRNDQGSPEEEGFGPGGNPPDNNACE